MRKYTLNKKEQNQVSEYKDLFKKLIYFLRLTSFLFTVFALRVFSRKDIYS
jgi:hypothetical protein